MTRTFTIRSVQDFLAAIKDAVTPRHTHITLYRGQCQDRALLPSLFRRFENEVHLIQETEAAMLKRLKERIPEHTPLRPKTDWDWLSFGQHYGLATRMLDWSARPAVAMYFALEGKPISPTVYCYHAQKSQIVDARTKQENPSGIELTRIMTPSVHSVRVALQEGWHTVHRLHPRRSGGKRGEDSHPP